MIRKLRRMRQNPMLALQYALKNPVKVAGILLVTVVVVLLVGVSVGTGLVPEWVGILGIAAVAGYVARLQYGRLRLLVRASEVEAGTVTPSEGVVKVSGTARAAKSGDGVSREGREGSYLAYKHVEKKSRSGQEGHSKSTDEAAVPMYVEDDTGTVLVDTNNANIRLQWDDKSSSGRRNTYWAALEAGDPVHVYGTAMAPDQRDPPGLVDSMSDVADAAQGRPFEEYADGEDVVLAKSAADPYLVVSDRSGLSLMARQVFWALLTTGITLALVAFAVANAAGVVGQ